MDDEDIDIDIQNDDLSHLEVKLNLHPILSAEPMEKRTTPRSSSSSSSYTYLHNKLFKEKVPLSILYNLFDHICAKKHGGKQEYYIMDENAFRSLLYNRPLYESFKQSIAPYYHVSKAFYILREHDTLSPFMTVIKQICKHQDIPLTHKFFYRDGVKLHEFHVYIIL